MSTQGILICTPRYNNWEFGAYSDSCYSLKKELDAAGIPHDFLKIGKESLITRGRNVCAASYLNDTDFSYMAFIDGDLDYDPAGFARLWNLCTLGADVAAGCYRHKDVLSTLSAWVDGKLRPLSDFKEPFEVDYAGTGFMMIRRETFTKLQQAHPEWEYDEGFPLDEKPGKSMTCWAFFQDPIAPWKDGRRFHLSEDFFFCNEVRKLGMKVMMDPAIELGHWGMYRY
ncbi:MAG TPA: hypothetical protein VIY48_19435 [Candidatus Paceibacterota bacterium]